MSVQKYETDALQEHVDSTPILVTRLDQWRHAVQTVSNYATGYLQVHQGITHHLEKTTKSLTEIPTFTGSPQSSENVGESQLSTVFKGLQQNVTLLLQRSQSTQTSIKSSVLPPLDSLSSEIDKHYKMLRNQGQRGIREVEKSRQDTQRAIEHLGQVTSSYGSRALGVHEDPYLLHRRVEAAIVDQVGRENTQAEAALSVQRSFAALEGHVISTIQTSLTSLDKFNEAYDRGEVEINHAVTSLFDNINMGEEWLTFAKANKAQLVPDQNYQRDPRNVTFANKDTQSTRPIVQGLLNRKGTVLKNYSQSFYVLSAAGFLYQFKNGEEASGTPDLALFLPDCQISRSSNDLVFKIVGKDALKTISTRHKFVFRTNSPRELDTWFSAISRVTGNSAAVNDDDSAEDTPVPSPTAGPGSTPGSPPTSQMANASLNRQGSQLTSPTQAQAPQTIQRVASPPAQTPATQAAEPSAAHSQGPQVTQTQVPQTQVPQTQVPQTQVPQTQVPQPSTVVSDEAPQIRTSTLNSETDPFRGF